MSVLVTASRCRRQSARGLPIGSSNRQRYFISYLKLSMLTHPYSLVTPTVGARR